jgi:hypothetical protein
MQTHSRLRTKKTCKRRPFLKRLKGFEPSTFCMASRTCVSLFGADIPCKRAVLVCVRHPAIPRLLPGDHAGLGTQGAPELACRVSSGLVELEDELVHPARDVVARHSRASDRAKFWRNAMKLAWRSGRSSPSVASGVRGGAAPSRGRNDIRPGSGPTWTAGVTEAGREYPRRSMGRIHRWRVTPMSVTQRLVDDVGAAGGSLRVRRRTRARRERGGRCSSSLRPGGLTGWAGT